MSSARDCSARAMLVSGRIGRAASQAGEQGQLGEAALFWSFFSGLGCEVFFLLLPLAMSVIRTLAALRGQACSAGAVCGASREHPTGQG